MLEVGAWRRHKGRGAALCAPPHSIGGSMAACARPGARGVVRTLCTATPPSLTHAGGCARACSSDPWQGQRAGDTGGSSTRLVWEEATDLSTHSVHLHPKRTGGCATTCSSSGTRPRSWRSRWTGTSTSSRAAWRRGRTTRCAWRWALPGASLAGSACSIGPGCNQQSLAVGWMGCEKPSWWLRPCPLHARPTRTWAEFEQRARGQSLRDCGTFLCHSAVGMCLPGTHRQACQHATGTRRQSWVYCLAFSLQRPAPAHTTLQIKSVITIAGTFSAIAFTISRFVAMGSG